MYSSEILKRGQKEILQSQIGWTLCPIVWLPYAPEYVDNPSTVRAQCRTIGPNTVYRQVIPNWLDFLNPKPIKVTVY